MPLTENQKRFVINPSKFKPKYRKSMKYKLKKKKKEFIEDLKFFIKHDPEFVWEIVNILIQDEYVKKEMIKEIVEQII